MSELCALCRAAKEQVEPLVKEVLAKYMVHGFRFALRQVDRIETTVNVI